MYEDTGMDWWKQIFAAFKKADIGQVAYVPDAGHAALIDACIADQDIHAIALTTEEEGVALLAGAWLGGVRGALLMQSSGVGNCINMFSLSSTCRFPLPVFVTMRGQWQEFNPWQHAMGESAQRHLETAGLQTRTAAEASEVGPLTTATLDKAFADGGMAALLLHQSLMPAKTFDQ
ncbi:MAG: phosphonopyruvate decarboxylase [Rhodospirillaceae bacterium]|nr:phosphonopyruvate decarboxylase [Rhodospirillaceae bacterium]MBL6941098.1 phosphonopyruvate decarboxylase [Rhodospirillales bacterium]